MFLPELNLFKLLILGTNLLCILLHFRLLRSCENDVNLNESPGKFRILSIEIVKHATENISPDFVSNINKDGLPETHASYRSDSRYTI